MADVPRFDPATLTNAVSDTVTVRRVFGEAYERGGATVIPVARLYAASGLGLGDGEGSGPMMMGWQGGRRHKADAEPVEAPTGEDAQIGTGSGHGGGGGYGVHVKAVGVYVIDDAGVHWRPALDVNRVILGGQLVAATALASVALAFAAKEVSKAAAGALSNVLVALAGKIPSR